MAKKVPLAKKPATKCERAKRCLKQHLDQHGKRSARPKTLSDAPRCRSTHACSVPSAAGDSSCSDATGDSSCSVSGAAGNGICADATGDGSEPPHACKGSYSDALSDGSCSIPGAADDGICSDAASDGLLIRLRHNRRQHLLRRHGGRLLLRPRRLRRQPLL
jgi:hypothetical protein